MGAFFDSSKLSSFKIISNSSLAILGFSEEGLLRDFLVELIDSLEDIFIENPTPERYLVLLQTGDETLNYKYAEKYFSGANIVIDEGGNHSFENLEMKIPQILLHFS